jgi:tetratricopeptide (TPR) repeat protein
MKGPVPASLLVGAVAVGIAAWLTFAGAKSDPAELPPVSPVAAPGAVAATPLVSLPSSNGTSLAPSTSSGLTASATGLRPDESALRYFAARGDKRRLDAEMARLKALYPNWTPPDDLFNPAPPGDAAVDRMWQLYSAGQYADVRAAIAARRTTDPQWQPPAALAQLLDQAEARQRLTNAADAKQWASVITVAASAPSLLTCQNVDMLWRVAEAFAETKRLQRARDAYGYVLANCDDSAERLATVQKALALLPEADLVELFRFERVSAGGSNEFDPIRQELARRHVGKAAEDPKASASSDDLGIVEQAANAETTPDDALLLGWYYYRHNDPTKALDWFKTARERGDSAKAAEGYVLTLDALGRALEAEPIAYQWRDASADNLAAYLDTAVLILGTNPPIRLDRAMLERIAAVTLQAKNANVAEQLGWYAYNIGQAKTALGWFATTLAWDPNHEAAAYGLAVASLKLKDRAGFSRVYASWASRSERIAALARPGVKLRGSAIYAPVPDATAPFTVGAPGGSVPAAATLPSGLPMTSLPSAAPTTAMVPPSAPVAVPPGAFPGSAVPASPVMPTAPGYATGPSVPPPIEEPGIAEVPLRTTDYGAAPAPSARPVSCAALAARHPPIATLSADAATRLGWCFMEVDRPFEASKAFARGIEIGSGRTRTDAAYGKSLADLRSGLTKDAAVAAAEAPQPVGRQIELTIAILAQRANAAFADGRYMETIIALDERARVAPEQNDLLVLRGFAYFKMGRLRDAQRIFQAVADTGYPDGMKGLAAVAAASRPN